MTGGPSIGRAGQWRAGTAIAGALPSSKPPLTNPVIVAACRRSEGCGRFAAWRGGRTRIASHVSWTGAERRGHSSSDAGRGRDGEGAHARHAKGGYYDLHHRWGAGRGASTPQRRCALPWRRRQRRGASLRDEHGTLLAVYQRIEIDGDWLMAWQRTRCVVVGGHSISGARKWLERTPETIPSRSPSQASRLPGGRRVRRIRTIAAGAERTPRFATDLGEDLGRVIVACAAARSGRRPPRRARWRAPRPRSTRGRSTPPGAHEAHSAEEPSARSRPRGSRRAFPATNPPGWSGRRGRSSSLDTPSSSYRGAAR